MKYIVFLQFHIEYMSEKRFQMIKAFICDYQKQLPAAGNKADEIEP